MIWWESTEKTADGVEINLKAVSTMRDYMVDIEIIVSHDERSKVVWIKTVPYQGAYTQEDLVYSYGSKLQQIRKKIAKRTEEKIFTKENF